MSEEKIKELLGLLELSQFDFEITLENNYAQLQPLESIAELAFRLRDEVGTLNFHGAIYRVRQWHFHHDDIKADNYATSFWGMYMAKPSDWIVAALIAKEIAE